MIVRCSGYHHCTTSLTKPELRFCAGLDPARGMSEIRDGEDLWQWSRMEIRLNAFRRSTIPQKHSCGSCPGILYGMAKVHKAVTDRCPFLQPILSAINTPSYKLAKFLVPLLTLLTSNDYTIKDSFSFAEEVFYFDCAHYMISFDIESVLIINPLEKTINICVDKPFENNTKVNNLTKKSFQSLLELVTLDSFFHFWWKMLQAETCSPLGPILANVFLCYFKEKDLWLPYWL